MTDDRVRERPWETLVDSARVNDMTLSAILANTSTAEEWSARDAILASNIKNLMFEIGRPQSVRIKS